MTSVLTAQTCIQTNAQRLTSSSLRTLAHRKNACRSIDFPTGLQRTSSFRLRCSKPSRFKSSVQLSLWRRCSRRQPSGPPLRHFTTNEQASARGRSQVEGLGGPRVDLYDVKVGGETRRFESRLYRPYEARNSAGDVTVHDAISVHRDQTLCP